MQLSQRAKQLIPKARIVSFANWKDAYSDEVIAIFQQADDEGRYLTDEDLEQIKTLSPQLSCSAKQAQLLSNKAVDIVAKARQEILTKYPNITQLGGGLYPPERAESCWRDLWHFLRCITYGIAGQKTQFTSQEGLDNMQLLYQELQVPLEPMLWGVENLKTASLTLFEAQESKQIAPYFEHLMSKMKNFLAAKR